MDNNITTWGEFDNNNNIRTGTFDAIVTSNPLWQLKTVEELEESLAKFWDEEWKLYVVDECVLAFGTSREEVRAKLAKFLAEVG